MTATEPMTDGSYRNKIVAVEPGGNEFIAEAEAGEFHAPADGGWTAE